MSMSELNGNYPMPKKSAKKQIKKAVKKAHSKTSVKLVHAKDVKKK